MGSGWKKSVGDAADAAALRPFGLSRVAPSQAKRAAAIAGVCADLLARQAERNLRILSGGEQ